MKNSTLNKVVAEIINPTGINTKKLKEKKSLKKLINHLILKTRKKKSD